MLPPLLQIDNCLVSTDIISECFCCDYAVCRGKCCIVGESGAPLDILPEKLCSAASDEVWDEVASLERDFPKYKDLLEEKGLEGIKAQGFVVTDRDGDKVTPLVDKGEECVFCHFENCPDSARCAEALDKRNCLCAIEMAGCSKPLSCSLYPIRTRRLASGLLALNLHRWDICAPAFAKGRKEGVRVYEFLRAPIQRAFGPEFWEALDQARKHLE